MMEGVVSLLQLLNPKDIRTRVFNSDRKKLDPTDKTKISDVSRNFVPYCEP